MKKTLPETKPASLPLKINGWKMIAFVWGPAYFQGRLLLVSGRVTLFIKPNENPSFCRSKEETKQKRGP